MVLSLALRRLLGSAAKSWWLARASDRFRYDAPPISSPEEAGGRLVLAHWPNNRPAGRNFNGSRRHNFGAAGSAHARTAPGGGARMGPPEGGARPPWSSSSRGPGVLSQAAGLRARRRPAGQGRALLLLWPSSRAADCSLGAPSSQSWVWLQNFHFTSLTFECLFVCLRVCVCVFCACSEPLFHPWLWRNCTRFPARSPMVAGPARCK